FFMENEHPKQPESSNDIYLAKHGDTNITIDLLDICYDRTQDDQEDTDDLDQERDLLASLIQKLKCEIDDSKNRNKFLESSNKALVDKLKGEIEDFKTKNKFNDVNYASKIQEDDECADVDSSLEVAYLACWSISELMSMLMDIKFSLVRVFGAGLKVECSSVAVLFFPSPRFFPLGFSWEGFLRRQDRLAVYTPMMLLRDDFEALYTLKWFFPIGVIVSVLFS
ncbi:hypothetical protein Tco_1367099, partial [Tanacetum coccineum]